MGYHSGKTKLHAGTSVTAITHIPYATGRSPMIHVSSLNAASFISNLLLLRGAQKMSAQSAAKVSYAAQRAAATT